MRVSLVWVCISAARPRGRQRGLAVSKAPKPPEKLAKPSPKTETASQKARGIMKTRLFRESLPPLNYPSAFRNMYMYNPSSLPSHAK
eukprot:192344-Pyramimonas_sp.AAC.1